MNQHGTPANLTAAHPRNRNAVKHGAYSEAVKAPRVAEVLEELVTQHPDEAPANLRALAELYVTAERLSDWVAARADGGISANGKITPPVLEARKGWFSIWTRRASSASRVAGAARSRPCRTIVRRSQLD
jgi:hypothetical protein